MPAWPLTCKSTKTAFCLRESFQTSDSGSAPACWKALLLRCHSEKCRRESGSHQARPAFPRGCGFSSRYAYRTALQILGDHGDAQDAIAEAFSAFVRLSRFRFGGFKDELHVLRTFNQITKYKALDEIRRRSRQVPADRWALPQDVPGAVPAERGRQLREALGLATEARIADVGTPSLRQPSWKGWNPTCFESTSPWGYRKEISLSGTTSRRVPSMP